MRYLYCLMLATFSWYFAFAQVNRAEYFIDIDPGVGKAAAVPFTAGTDISIKFNVPLTAIVPGVHSLYVRTRDAQGRWSLTSTQDFLVSDLSIKSSTVNRAEYFLDSDPGIGLGKDITLTGGGDVTTKFNVPLANVTPGVHTLYVRAQDNQGRWSLTYQQNFYINALAVANRKLLSAEYFIDADPGIGKGTGVSLPAGSNAASLAFNVDLKKLADGLHTLNVRIRDNQGSWSLTSSQVFFVSSAQIENIVALQYQFTNPGFTSQTYTYSIPVPAPSVDLNFKAGLGDLPVDQAYSMSIIAVTALGAHSLAQTRTVKVCSGVVPDAAYDVVQNGTNVNFTAKDTSKVRYMWDFGDKKQDSIGTVLHKYAKSGSYQVRLITSNFCYSDTLIKTINVLGIDTVVANHGGNTGQVSVQIVGAGFTGGTQVFLQNGGTNIAPLYSSAVDANHFDATFNLAGQATGLYNVIALSPDHTTDTLHNGFRVENGNAPKLSVTMTGDRVIRVGFNQVYTVTYSNDGNTDAVLVPLTIAGLPINTSIEMVEPSFKLYSLPGFENTQPFLDTLNHTMNDDATNAAFRILYLSNIPAGSSGSLHFIFHLPDNAILHSTPDVQVILGGGLQEFTTGGTGGVGSPADTAAETPGIKQYADCASNLFILAGSFLKDLAQDVLKEELKSLSNCLVGGAGTLEKVADLYVKHNQGKKIEAFDWVDFGYGTVSTLKDCAAAAIPQARIVKYITAVADAHKYWDQGAELSLDGYNALNSCAEAFFPNAWKHFRSIVGNAFDPNDKFGPGDESDAHYTNQKLLNYVVNFENQPTANLPAQTVTVIDTISKSLNFGTFGFTSLTLGDSVYTFAPVRSLIHDFDLTAKYGVKARVIAKFDTVTGVAQWKFLTIDPATDQVTTNALAGFLPPDQVSPEGQGYVGYQVRAKPNVATGDVVANQAFITFDFNPVISTKVWKNTFDFVPPTSKVNPLPQAVADTNFTVSWAGSDGLSGAGYYNIYYSVNKGAYRQWLYYTPSTTAIFTGKPDSAYNFYSIALDNAGNIETAKSSADASTTVKLKKSQSITFVPFAPKAYGDSDFDPGATASSGLAVVYLSSDTSVAKIVNGKVHIQMAGTAGIMALQAGNEIYAPESLTNMLTVTKALLTVGVADTSRFFGQPNPEFRLIYSGFVYGEGPANLTSLPVVATNATTASPVGTYPITVNGGYSANYDLSYVTGTLTVNAVPAPAIVAFSPAEAVAGDEVTITGSGFDNTTQVTFGGTPAHSFTVISSTNITAVVDTGGSGDVTVVTPGGTATLGGFTFRFLLPADNFQISVTDATCNGAADGIIALQATQNLNYTVMISGNGVNMTYPFTSTQSIPNLAAGSYHLCILVSDQPAYQQCYDLQVGEPKPLSVYSFVNNQSNTLDLSLSGGSLYNIQLNGIAFTTSNDHISLQLQEGNNQLLVTTDKLCQGSYEKLIYILKKIVPYPDPFEKVLNINLGDTVVNKASFEVYNINNGSLVYKQQTVNTSGVIQLDLSKLGEGTYALHIIIDNTERVYKIIKK